MNLEEALRLGEAIHDSGMLRVRRGFPEFRAGGPVGCGWQRVDPRVTNDLPPDDWLRIDAKSIEALANNEPRPLAFGNVVFWTMRGGVKPDGSLSSVGMAVCDAYARLWAATGTRDGVLERGYPELAWRFDEIRSDAEILEYHLLEVPPCRPARLVVFPGGRPLDQGDTGPVEPLLRHSDGSFSLMFNPLFRSKEDGQWWANELRSPVYAARMLQLGETLVPGTVILERGGAGDAYISLEEWCAAIDRAEEIRVSQPR